MEVIASRYEVLATVRREVGRTLLRAHDRQLDHAVALKIIDLTDDDARRDLLDEARMLVKLPPHPSLPTMRGDFAIDETHHAIVMDWIEGQNLSELLEAKGTPGLPATDVAVYVTQAAAALDHLHANVPPIVHGDVKPSNLLITATGRVVLVDFGIARPAGARVDAGTRGFVAPEVPRGDPTTPAVDVYGLAATACALLTRSPPAPRVLHLVHVDPVVAVPLASALKSGLATRPDRRPPSAGALADRISAAQRALPAGMVTFLSLELVASVYLWDSDDGDLVATRERLDDQVLAVIEDHAGRAIPSDTDPNRLLVVFTSVTAAAATALAVHAHLARARWSAGVVIRARAGLHMGEAELRAGRYSGGVVARAGRLR